jgi:serine protease AprX
MGDSNGYLYSPPDLETDLFPIPYSTGARIHSNSWGAVDTYSYETDDLNTDSFLYDNTDFLVLFAAGNDGSVGDCSVGSPAQSKNALTVGASETGRYRERKREKRRKKEILFLSKVPKICDYFVYF